MSEAGYLLILKELGVDTQNLSVNNGWVLRMRNGSKVDGVYFNRNRAGVVHFTVNPNSSVVIDWSLWEDLPDEQIKQKDRGKPNVVPNPGMERRALRQLLESAGVL